MRPFSGSKNVEIQDTGSKNVRYKILEKVFILYMDTFKGGMDARRPCPLNPNFSKFPAGVRKKSHRDLSGGVQPFVLKFL